jgi:LacI family transcriptional regulator
MQTDQAHEAVTSILEYGRHVAGWEFVGVGSTPFYDPDRSDQRPFDGLIGNDLPVLQSLAMRRKGVAIVGLSADVPADSLVVVTHDDHVIGRMGGEYLLGRGFPQYAFFGIDQATSSLQRLAGFQETIADAGRRCHVRLCPQPAESDAPSDREWVYQWLGEVPKPIAIMTHMDYLARLTVNAAVNQGLRVPDEVAVLGVSDNLWTSVLAALPVSSIRLNMRRLGYVAAETLDALMAGGAMPPPRYVPPLGVVTRLSTDITLVDDPLIRRATTYIRDHAVEGITVEDVLDELGVSRSTLVKRMRAATGQTTQQAIRRAQVDRAKQMLVSTEMTMDQIARKCGFHRQPRLNEAFKRLTGMTPGPVPPATCPMNSAP